jgi:hypothetical protein
VVAFRAVRVFPDDQTSGHPPREFCTPLAGNDPLRAFAELVRVAATLGFRVEDHVFANVTPANPAMRGKEQACDCGAAPIVHARGQISCRYFGGYDCQADPFGCNGPRNEEASA